MRPARSTSERFELLELLGAGGNGAVHRARDTALGVEVALKGLARTEGVDGFRFKREFRAFSALHLLARAARYRRGQWCGEPTLAGEAAEALRHERIADPAAVVRLLLPG